MFNNTVENNKSALTAELRLKNVNSNKLENDGNINVSAASGGNDDENVYVFL